MAHITRWGTDFEVAEKFGYYELITFARIAKGQGGEELDELDQMLAVDQVLGACFADGVYPQFEAVARKERADLDELVDVMKEAIGVISENPTRSPSDSSDGQSTTSANASGDSSSRALRLVGGRVDLAYMVEEAQKAQAG